MAAYERSIELLRLAYFRIKNGRGCYGCNYDDSWDCGGREPCSCEDKEFDVEVCVISTNGKQKPLECIYNVKVSKYILPKGYPHTTIVPEDAELAAEFNVYSCLDDVPIELASLCKQYLLKDEKIFSQERYRDARCEYIKREEIEKQSKYAFAFWQIVVDTQKVKAQEQNPCPHVGKPKKKKY